MVSLKALAVALLAAGAGVISAPAATYFWSSWTDGKSKITQNNGPDGKFSVKWSGDKGNFVLGKGWNTGSSRFFQPPQSLFTMEDKLTHHQRSHLLRYLPPKGKRLPRRLRLDHQPARRVLHHRGARRPPPVRQPRGQDQGQRHQRRRHVRDHDQEARQQAVDPGHRDV